MKTNLKISVLALILTACSGPINFGHEESEEVVEETKQELPEYYDEPNDDPAPNSCRLYKTVTGRTRDGKLIPVPVECTEFYFDMGDPAPELNPVKIYQNIC